MIAHVIYEIDYTPVVEDAMRAVAWAPLILCLGLFLHFPEEIFASYRHKRTKLLRLLEEHAGGLDIDILQFSYDLAAMQEPREEDARMFEKLVTDTTRLGFQMKRTVLTLWHPAVTEVLRKLSPVLLPSFWAWMQTFASDALFRDSILLSQITTYSWLDCRQINLLLRIRLDWRQMKTLFATARTEPLSELVRCHPYLHAFVPDERREAIWEAAEHPYLFWFHGRCSGDKLLNCCYRTQTLTPDALGSLLALAFDLECFLLGAARHISTKWFEALETRAAGDSQAITGRFNSHFWDALAHTRACLRQRRRLDRLLLDIRSGKVKVAEFDLPGRETVLSSFLYLAATPLLPTFRRALEQLEDSAVILESGPDYPLDAAINLSTDPHSNNLVFIFRELFRDEIGLASWKGLSNPSDLGAILRAWLKLVPYLPTGFVTGPRGSRFYSGIFSKTEPAEVEANLSMVLTLLHQLSFEQQSTDWFRWLSRVLPCAVVDMVASKEVEATALAAQLCTEALKKGEYLCAMEHLKEFESMMSVFKSQLGDAWLVEAQTNPSIDALLRLGVEDEGEEADGANGEVDSLEDVEDVDNANAEDMEKADDVKEVEKTEETEVDKAEAGKTDVGRTDASKAEVDFERDEERSASEAAYEEDAKRASPTAGVAGTELSHTPVDGSLEVCSLASPTVDVIAQIDSESEEDEDVQRVSPDSSAASATKKKKKKKKKKKTSSSGNVKAPDGDSVATTQDLDDAVSNVLTTCRFKATSVEDFARNLVTSLADCKTAIFDFYDPRGYQDASYLAAITAANHYIEVSSFMKRFTSITMPSKTLRLAESLRGCAERVSGAAAHPVFEEEFLTMHGDNQLLSLLPYQMYRTLLLVEYSADPVTAIYLVKEIDKHGLTSELIGAVLAYVLYSENSLNSCLMRLTKLVLEPRTINQQQEMEVFYSTASVLVEQRQKILSALKKQQDLNPDKPVINLLVQFASLPLNFEFRITYQFRGVYHENGGRKLVTHALILSNRDFTGIRELASISGPLLRKMLWPAARTANNAKAYAKMLSDLESFRKNKRNVVTLAALARLAAQEYKTFYDDDLIASRSWTVEDIMTILWEPLVAASNLAGIHLNLTARIVATQIQTMVGTEDGICQNRQLLLYLTKRPELQGVFCAEAVGLLKQYFAAVSQDVPNADACISGLEYRGKFCLSQIPILSCAPFPRAWAEVHKACVELYQATTELENADACQFAERSDKVYSLRRLARAKFLLLGPVITAGVIQAIKKDAKGPVVKILRTDSRLLSAAQQNSMFETDEGLAFLASEPKILHGMMHYEALKLQNVRPLNFELGSLRSGLQSVQHSVFIEILNQDKDIVPWPVLWRYNCFFRLVLTKLYLSSWIHLAQYVWYVEDPIRIGAVYNKILERTMSDTRLIGKPLSCLQIMLMDALTNELFFTWHVVAKHSFKHFDFAADLLTRMQSGITEWLSSRKMHRKCIAASIELFRQHFTNFPYHMFAIDQVVSGPLSALQRSVLRSRRAKGALAEWITSLPEEEADWRHEGLMSFEKLKKVVWTMMSEHPDWQARFLLVNLMGEDEVTVNSQISVGDLVFMARYLPPSESRLLDLLLQRLGIDPQILVDGDINSSEEIVQAHKAPSSIWPPASD